MKHHQYHPDFQFVVEPIDFDKFTEREVLQYCLGATLYMPGSKNILDKVVRKELYDLTSVVMCFEDAIKEENLSVSEENVLMHLTALHDKVSSGELTYKDLPLLFVRVRNFDQFTEFTKMLNENQAKILSGFVFPKFSSLNGVAYFEHLKETNKKLGSSFYAMPLLEGRLIALRETRVNELEKIAKLLEPYQELILNIRVGGTDLSSIFGVRRGIDYSIYDILTVRDALSDIVNFFSRDIYEYVISGPVWEYFLAFKQDNLNNMFKSNLHRSLMNRNIIVNEAIDGLLREVILDKANNLFGKTIIHPSHARFVNAMQTVTKEEYDDAMQILDTSGGVIKSAKANKMNEINPHRSWANKVANRAKAFGVIANEESLINLLIG